MRVVVAVGARPNVVKVGPLLPVLARNGIDADVAFTGSEHDCGADPGSTLSFYGVELPAPRWFLDIGTGTEAVLTGRSMTAFENLFARHQPDAVLVVGDVSATLAAAVSAAKAGIPVVHLDAGLRCGDLGQPEEINRVLVSRVAAMHLTPTEVALENLEDEGIDPERIHFVGSLLAESVLSHLDAVARSRYIEERGLVRREYILGSFHRPENLTNERRLSGIVDGLARSPLPIVLPDRGDFVAAVESAGLTMPASVRIQSAVPYRAMIALEREAAAVITDSGGVQEEACMLCVPCVTVRECTEQSVTTAMGANRLIAPSSEQVRAALVDAVSGRCTWSPPKRWDKAVSDRVVRALRRGIIPLS